MSTPPFIRSPYNYDAAEVSLATATTCLDPSLTVQSDAEDADINTIVRRFGVTGQLPEAAQLPQFGDFTEVMDFQTAHNAVRRAQEQFMALPPQVRAAFYNDPQRLLEASQQADFEAKFAAMFREPDPTPPAPPEPPKGG